MKNMKLVLISVFYILSYSHLIAAPGDPDSPIRQKFEAFIFNLHKNATGESDVFLNLHDGSAFQGKEFGWRTLTVLLQKEADKILDELNIDPFQQQAEAQELQRLVSAKIKEWDDLKSQGKPIYPIVPTDIANKTPEQAWAELMKNYKHYAAGLEDQLLNFGNGFAYHQSNFHQNFSERNIFTYFKALKDKYQNDDMQQRLTNAYTDTIWSLQKIVDSPLNCESESRDLYAKVRPFGYNMHIKLHQMETHQFKYLNAPAGSFSEAVFDRNKRDEAAVFSLPAQVRNRSVSIGFNVEEIDGKVLVSVEEISADGAMPVKRIPLVRYTADLYRTVDALTITSKLDLRFRYYAEADKNYRLVFSNPAGQDSFSRIRITGFALGK